MANYSFNETILNEVLAFYSGMNETNIPVAAKAKYARVQEKAGRDSTSRTRRSSSFSLMARQLCISQSWATQ